MCRRETAWESRDCKNAKRSPFVFVLVWVYFEHERFESGFRDLTLRVKVLRDKQVPRYRVNCRALGHFRSIGGTRSQILARTSEDRFCSRSVLSRFERLPSQWLGWLVRFVENENALVLRKAETLQDESANLPGLQSQVTVLRES